MNEQFVWRRDYCIGVEEVDAQHENLFRIANRLEAHLEPGQLQQELMNLYRHTREHFGAEEALMRRIDYPGYREHQRQHDTLLDALNHRVAEVVRNPPRIGAFQAFLAEWICDHILTQDQLIAGYLRRAGGSGEGL